MRDHVRSNMSAGGGTPRRSKDRQHRSPLVGEHRRGPVPLSAVEFEEAQRPTRMRASHFWKKCDEALVDTFSLAGVKFSRVLQADCPGTSVPELVSILKPWTAYWLPLVLGDDLPPQKVADPYSLLDGPFRTYWRNRMTGKGRRRRLSLATLMLYSKRLFPALPEQMVSEKIKDYGVALARPEPEIYPEARRVRASIVDSVMELPEMVADYTRAFAPSTSSCYESSRREGGLQGYVRKNVLPGLIAEHPYLQVVEELADKMSDGDLMLTNWSAVWYEVLEQLLKSAEEVDVGSETYTARVAGIPEPLKVRLVTRQSWVLSLLTPIQKAWHTAMRQNPVYQLIGGVPVRQAIAGLRLSKGQKFVSGDYEAATDNIFLRYTEYAATQMLDRTRIELPDGLEAFGPLIRRIALRSLTEITVDLGDGGLIPVTRGQMMGHILSFPLLCLINRSASCLAIPRDRFMRVNGDDVLFPASPEEYSRWKISTSYVGLKFSLGKNYFSRDLALINSEFYIWSKEEGHLVQLPVPNVGLLGYQREMVDPETGAQILPWDQYGAIWSAFERTLSPQQWRPAFRLFKKRYPALGSFPGPLVGPRELGALGGRVPPDWQFRRTELLWMEAHRSGQFDFREGVASDYSRIQDRFSDVLRKESAPYVVWGIPPGNSTMPPVNLVPDPYRRGGGYAERIMALRRWLVKPVTLKKATVFGRRRWRRFLQRGGAEKLHPLGGTALQSVLTNTWSEPRRMWYEVRLYHRIYQETPRYFHEIFREP
nr:MAG: putative RNA-dependent RNA polymerase [Narnaviridae sp.]